MLNLIIGSIYFILPAYIANMFPVIFCKLKLPEFFHFIPFSKPINKELFGDHKTWRGFYAGYLGALLGLYLQFLAQKNGLTTAANFPATLLNYENISIFFYAFLFGIGALTGDLIKSFFKRRFNIKPGKPWFPFDQLDFVIGALLFISPFYLPLWQNILTILLITPILHFLANLTGYLLKLKKVWS